MYSGRTIFEFAVSFKLRRRATTRRGCRKKIRVFFLIGVTELLGCKRQQWFYSKPLLVLFSEFFKSCLNLEIDGGQFFRSHRSSGRTRGRVLLYAFAMRRWNAFFKTCFRQSLDYCAAALFFLFPFCTWRILIYWIWLISRSDVQLVPDTWQSVRKLPKSSVPEFSLVFKRFHLLFYGSNLANKLKKSNSHRL